MRCVSLSPSLRSASPCFARPRSLPENSPHSAQFDIFGTAFFACAGTGGDTGGRGGADAGAAAEAGAGTGAGTGTEACAGDNDNVKAGAVLGVVSTAEEGRYSSNLTLSAFNAASAAGAPGST